MIKVMAAKFPGKCGDCGKGIRAGETIKFNTETRTAAHGDKCPGAEHTVTLSGELLRERIKAGGEIMNAAISVVNDQILENHGERPTVCPKCKGEGRVTVSVDIRCDWTETFSASGPCGSKFTRRNDSAPYTASWDVEAPEGMKVSDVKRECVDSFNAARQWDRVTGEARERALYAAGIHRVAEEVNRCAMLLKVTRGVKVSTWAGRNRQKVSGVVKWYGPNSYGEGDRVGIDTGGEKLTYVPPDRCQVEEVTVSVSY